MDTRTTPGAMLSVGQAAERLGTPVRFVRRLVAERRIPFHRVGRYIRIAETDLNVFLADGRVEPTTHRPDNLRPDSPHLDNRPARSRGAA